VSKDNCEDLYGRETLKRLLRRYNLRADSNLGQHFLVDRGFLEIVARGAGSGETALEIGAGPGSLTCLLKEKFARVCAVEVDSDFRVLFSSVNPEPSVEFIQADILGLNVAEIGLEDGNDTVLVGNIPYNITGKVLEKTIAERGYFAKAVFTTQKEVADRVLAAPGTRECGAITYLVQAYGDVTHLEDIPSDAFYPSPEVDSSVIEIDFSSGKKFESDEDLFMALVRGLFNYRRKTTRKGLIISPKFSLEREEVDELMGIAEVDSRKRPEELTLKEFDSLAQVLQERLRGEE